MKLSLSDAGVCRQVSHNTHTSFWDSGLRQFSQWWVLERKRESCCIGFIFFFFHCVTQLKLYTGDKLSSTIFCCLWVSVWGIGNTRPNLHFFQYIQAYKPFADHVPPNSKQYQLILTKSQPVSSYTDPVPSSTTYNSSSRKTQFSQLNNFSFYNSIDESRTVYLV